MKFHILLITFHNTLKQLLHSTRFYGKIQASDHIAKIHLWHTGHVKTDLIQIYHPGQIQRIPTHPECIFQIQGICRQQITGKSTVV